MDLDPGVMACLVRHLHLMMQVINMYMEALFLHMEMVQAMVSIQVLTNVLPEA